MDIRFSTEPVEAVACDLLAVAITEDLDAGLAALDRHFKGTLRPHVEAKKFTGAAGSTLRIPTFGHLPAKELLLLGVGKGEPSDLQAAAARAGRQAREAGARQISLDFGAGDAAAWIEALITGNYAYLAFKPETDRPAAAERLTVRSSAAPSSSAVKRAVSRAAGQSLARDLVNAPAAEMYPETLAQAAQTLQALPHTTVEILDEEGLAAEGYVGILAVGQASDRPPRMIHVRYSPPGATQRVVLVGKGVTFDAGGLSLKPSGAMQEMRCDMGGAATMLGVGQIVATQGLPIAVDVIIGAVENMVNGNSFKLGDVITYQNGVSVEIHNTDAEGRLVLADCLIRACEQPDVTHVIDAATLTGACVVAIGSDFTGLFSDDEALCTSLQDAAAQNGEGLWRLPLHAPYKEMLKAKWGQIKNLGGRDAGASTAALFLQHFVTDKVRWAHLDIAGSAFIEAGTSRYAPGATGEMVRSLATWIEGLD